MQQYKNVGGQFRRSSGELVPRGGTFTPTVEEERRMIARHQIGTRFRAAEPVDLPAPDAKLREVLEADRAAREAPPAREGTSAVEPEEEWTSKLTPEEYLERWPNGPQSDLARLYVYYNETSK